MRERASSTARVSRTSMSESAELFLLAGITKKKKVTKAFSESNRSCNDTTGKRMAYILGGISKTEKYCVTRTSLLHLQSLVSTLFAYFLLLHRYRGLKYINHMNHLFFSSILVIPNTSDVDRSRLFFFFKFQNLTTAV